MNNKLEEMVLAKNPQDDIDFEYKLREIIQEVVLASLSTTDFFAKAAFYGGTSLRIFYGLPRFSEDLDFMLLTPDSSFSWAPYFNDIKRVFSSYGLSVSLVEKEKIQASDTRSAFLKENTIELMTIMAPNYLIKNRTNPDQLIKVKFEIDTEAPKGALTNIFNLTDPFFSNVRVLTLPSLFAGKIGALLTRNWKNRVKGRDLFDYLFYVGKNVSINLPFLENNLLKARVSLARPLSLDETKTLLQKKFLEIDYPSAKDDVKNFIENPTILNNWSSQYFIDSLSRLQE